MSPKKTAERDSATPSNEQPSTEPQSEAPLPPATPENPSQEGQTEEPKASAWGAFKIEVGVEPPSRAGISTKYPWAEFPAPADPNNPKTWPSVFIPDVGGKTIYGSIKSYRDQLQKEGKPAPEFTVTVVKEPKGVRVFRKS